MRQWFTSAGNEVSSAHFGISKSGEIDQYVDIRRMAWTQGITAVTLSKVKAQIVKDKCRKEFVNPNKFLIGIEHEGTDGQLTEAQLAASVWLHKYITDEVARIWGESERFPLNSYTVVGHFQIDPVRKPYCPGPKFPWQELYTRIGEDDEMALKESQKRFKPFAQDIIDGFLGPAWGKHNEAYLAAKKVGNAAEAKKQLALRDRQHTLAEEARKAAGIK
jgi:N-acetyl-anhydromuramyl-L-alanine amidase AmpD